MEETLEPPIDKNEVWLPVEGYPLYEVSDFGRVRNAVRGNILRSSKQRNGYLAVHLSRDGVAKTYTIHRLVCRAHHGEPSPEQTQVRHLDGRKENCRAENLAWGTVSQNRDDARRHGTISRRGGVSVLSEDDIRAIRAAPMSQYHLAARYGVSQATISMVQSRKRWGHVPD